MMWSTLDVPVNIAKWTMAKLVCRQEIQQKLQDEIDDIVDDRLTAMWSNWIIRHTKAILPQVNPFFYWLKIQF